MNEFEKQLVEHVRKMPDEVLAAAVGQHIGRVLKQPKNEEEAPPTKKKTTRLDGRPFYEFEFNNKLFLMWNVRETWFIQDKKSKRQKTKPVTKVSGRHPEEAQNALKMQLMLNEMEGP